MQTGVIERLQSPTQVHADDERPPFDADQQRRARQTRRAGRGAAQVDQQLRGQILVRHRQLPETAIALGRIPDDTPPPVARRRVVVVRRPASAPRLPQRPALRTVSALRRHLPQHHRVVGAASGHELRVRAALDDAAVLEQQNQIRAPNRR